MAADSYSLNLKTYCSPILAGVSTAPLILPSSTSSLSSPGLMTHPNLKTKTTSNLGLTNDTLPFTPHIRPSTSAAPHMSTITHSTTDVLKGADSAQLLLGDVLKLGTAEKKGVVKHSIKRMSTMGRGGGREGRVGNSKHYVKMGLVMESPTKISRWPWMMSSHAAISSVDVASSSGSVVTRGDVAAGTDVIGGVASQSSPPIYLKIDDVENNRRYVGQERGGEEVEGVMSSLDSGYGNTPDQALVQTLPLPMRRNRSGAIRGIDDYHTRGRDADVLGLRSSCDGGGLGVRGSGDAGGLSVRGSSDVGFFGVRDSCDAGGLGVRNRCDAGGLGVRDSCDGGLGVRDRCDAGGLGVRDSCDGGLGVRDSCDAGGLGVRDSCDGGLGVRDRCDAGGLGVRDSCDGGLGVRSSSDVGGIGVRGNSNVGGIGVRGSCDTGGLEPRGVVAEGLESGRLRDDTQDSAFFMDVSLNHEARSSSMYLQHEGTFPFRKATSSPSEAAGTVSSLEATHCATTRPQQLPYRHTSPNFRPSSSLFPSSTFSAISSSESPYFKRKNNRSYSRKAVSKASEPRSKSVSTSNNLLSGSPPWDEKDYFQVTDELSQENAHFSLSEALLVVMEQYKANCLEKERFQTLSPLPGSSMAATSSPSSPLPSSSIVPTSSPSSPLPCSLMAPTSPTSSLFLPMSASPPQWQRSSLSSSSGWHSSWSLMSSMASVGDECDQGNRLANISLLGLMKAKPCDRSAESTAQKLLQHLARLLSASTVDLSELAVHLPTDFLVLLQMDEDLQKSVMTLSTHMRGSKDWAPPRKQIIYQIKRPSKNMLDDLACQDYRCTGCGMKVDPSLSKHFRFCNYVGKYFCQNCHTNSTHILPSHILERWSFRKMLVSNFARDVLNKLKDEPVFSVSTSHSIYKKVAAMSITRNVRTQLVSIKQYLKTCRHAQPLNQLFDEAVPWTTDLTSFTLNDFLAVREWVKLRQLRAMLADGVSHIKSCPVCQGKGFVCEFCINTQDIIFPFEAQKVSSCKDCRCCFHKDCFKNSTACPRCSRMKERQQQRVQKIVLEEEMDDEGGPS